MKKMRGIWIVIILILGIGISATRYTRKYTSVPAETRKEQAAGSETESGILKMILPADESSFAAGRDRGIAEAPSAGIETNAPEESEPIGAVKLRLIELDDQIARNHLEGQDQTTNSLKAFAESEKKLWEAEIERILTLLSDKLDEKQRDDLFMQQKEWIRERETQAISASQKQKGSALEELEYNLFLKKAARERAYGLEAQYHVFLMEAD